MATPPDFGFTCGCPIGAFGRACKEDSHDVQIDHVSIGRGVAFLVDRGAGVKKVITFAIDISLVSLRFKKGCQFLLENDMFLGCKGEGMFY